MSISKALFLHLYSDTKPRHQLIAKLQKGLILVSNETELAGEGIGLGVPAVRYRDRTYFSGSSTMKFQQAGSHAVVIKKFTLNLTSQRTLRNVRVETNTARKIRRSFDKLYMKHKQSRLLVFENVLRHAGVKREFVQTKPAGSAIVVYNIDPPYVGVKAEFRLLQDAGIQEIFLLNEQGSKHFRKYYDSNGTVLCDTDIGAWETVDANWACIYSVENNVGFRLWKHEDAVLHRGREFLNGAIDWVGLDYGANPENMCFEYNIELVRS